MKRVSVLGSTGSIGTQTLEIVEKFPDLFSVEALTAGRNINLLRKQIKQFNPKFVAVADHSDAKSLKSEFPSLEVGSDREGLEYAASISNVELVVMGILGFAALAPTLVAVRNKKTVALANKESIITAGSLLKEEIKKSDCLCIPVDSEHNALYQLLIGQDRNEIRSIVLTASGGPLWKKPEMPLEAVTPELATDHPNWSMGKKISVDSATLMNKGLELVEAHVLFDFAPTEIEVWIHPQSIVHGAVWFKDNSCIAQMNKPDMKCSIGYAMAYPARLPDVIEKLSFKDFANLEFYEPNDERFPSINLARSALTSGPSYLIALNALNEIAVHAFLEKKVSFPQITRIIEAGLDSHKKSDVRSLEDVFSLDEEARCVGTQILQQHMQ